MLCDVTWRCYEGCHECKCFAVAQICSIFCRVIVIKFLLCNWLASTAKLSSPFIVWTIINNKFWEELFTCFPWYDTGHIEIDASNKYSIVACVFVIAVTFLPSRCLATMGEFLPSSCLATIRGFLPIRCLATIGKDTRTHTQTET
jgi:hypothetical protein